MRLNEELREIFETFFENLSELILFLDERNVLQSKKYTELLREQLFRIDEIIGKEVK